jgi:transcriptional regulator with XRE-family HTH domain
MNVESVRDLLRAECKAMGGEKRFAEKAGVSVQLIYAVEIGVREPRGKVLDALGLEAVVTYRRKKPIADVSNKSQQDYQKYT